MTKKTYTCPSCGEQNSRKHPKWSYLRICNHCGHVANAYWFRHPEQAANAYTTAINKGG